ncbi:unnamed protein product [Prorocentrum cordatum]|uniref:Uncharacterized protein n=1 Tax=Prorocentrum cordatum TaxID=2364126 RepID=A0ABN9TXS2_9DINO|nr:unnamed protein product [Polarella glacialis]
MGTRSSRGGASYWYAFLCPRGGPCACVALPGPARATWPARVLPCQGRRLTFSQWAAPRPSKRLAYAAPSRGALGQTRPLSRADRSRDRGRCAGGWSVVERPGTDRPRGCPRRLWLSLAVGAWCLCCRDPELEEEEEEAEDGRGEDTPALPARSDVSAGLPCVSRAALGRPGRPRSPGATCSRIGDAVVRCGRPRLYAAEKS